MAVAQKEFDRLNKMSKEAKEEAGKCDLFRALFSFGEIVKIGYEATRRQATADEVVTVNRINQDTIKGITKAFRDVCGCKSEVIK